jgi:hypothetical protein
VPSLHGPLGHHVQRTGADVAGSAGTLAGSDGEPLVVGPAMGHDHGNIDSPQQPARVPALQATALPSSQRAAARHDRTDRIRTNAQGRRDLRGRRAAGDRPRPAHGEVDERTRAVGERDDQGPHQFVVGPGELTSHTVNECPHHQERGQTQTALTSGDHIPGCGLAERRRPFVTVPSSTSKGGKTSGLG